MILQVIGKISDVEKSEIEWKAGENGMGMNVEIEGPGKDVKTAPANANVNPESVPNKATPDMLTAGPIESVAGA